MYVSLREGENFEDLFRRFKRAMEAAGILREYRRQPAAADVVVALGQAARGRDEDMLRRVLVVLGCWTLLSILVGLALAWMPVLFRADLRLARAGRTAGREAA